jgi:predicted HicB family RNase H-like nuclease
MNSMTYKGYSARVIFEAEDRIFVGRVAVVRDIVSFHGTSVDELEVAFREAVDDYLAACEKLGQTPNKPFSGRVMLRLPLELHARMRTHATVEGMSFNQWAVRALQRAIFDR